MLFGNTLFGDLSFIFRRSEAFHFRFQNFIPLTKTMQAPKNELFMLNWEIFDLKKKLETFANVYSVIDVWTVDCLSELIATVDSIMTGTSIKPYGDWDNKDEKIFNGYSFHHSINCKQCGRAVKIAKPTLLKHLKDCKPTTEECTSKKQFSDEVFEITLGVPRKTKPGNETRAACLKGSVGTKRGTSSQSTSTVASKQYRPKQVDNQKQVNKQNTITKSPETNQPSTEKRGKRRRTRCRKAKHTDPNPIPRSKSDTSVQSNSSGSTKQNGPKKDTENGIVPTTDNSAQSSSTVASKSVDKSEQLNGHNPKNESISSQKGDESKRDTPAQSSSTKTPIAPNQNLPKQVDKLTNITTKKHQKYDEPKRKIHRPNRTRDGEYVTKGSIPDHKVDLTKKTIKFISNVKSETSSMVGDNSRKELSISPAHDNIVKSLEGLFKTSYPKAKAYPFGSRITGLGKETSDLDIYLDLEGNYDGSRKYSKDKLKWCVLLTEQYLKLSDQWSKLDPVTAARTPILRAWNTKEKIDCDISFTHGLSHCNTKLIQYLFDLQPVCYYVALYAKTWASNFSMDGLNTYTLVLLAIFYFQKHNLLPCIHSLQKSCKDPMFITHWQANFEKKSLEELKIPRIPDTEVENHILKFFSFYGSKFCFETRVVCPLLGWAPQKEDFDPFDREIPLEMENLQTYYDKIDMKLAHPVNDLLSYMKPMVVQDPFELIHNVAKGVSPADVNRFKKFCALTATLLYEVLNETA